MTISYQKRLLIDLFNSIRIMYLLSCHHKAKIMKIKFLCFGVKDWFRGPRSDGSNSKYIKINKQTTDAIDVSILSKWIMGRCIYRISEFWVVMNQFTALVVDITDSQWMSVEWDVLWDFWDRFSDCFGFIFWILLGEYRRMTEQRMGSING